MIKEHADLKILFVYMRTRANYPTKRCGGRGGTFDQMLAYKFINEGSDFTAPPFR